VLVVPAPSFEFDAGDLVGGELKLATVSWPFEVVIRGPDPGGEGRADGLFIAHSAPLFTLLFRVIHVLGGNDLIGDDGRPLTVEPIHPEAAGWGRYKGGGNLADTWVAFNAKFLLDITQGAQWP
jgi:hypothetical protein